MTLRKLMLTSVTAAAMSCPIVVSADSSIAWGSGSASTTASLDFEIILEDFVYFRIGTDVNGTVDTVTFDLTGVPQGTGTPVDDSGTWGAQGYVDVDVQTNLTTVDVSSAWLGAGIPGPIEGDITVGQNLGNITNPGFGGTTSLGGGPIDLQDQWTFQYQNDNIYAAGTYTDTLVYTAAAP